jgi:type IV secretion system protein VirB9
VIKPFAAAFLAALAAGTSAYALERPTPGHADGRIRYVAYDSGNVVELWSTPGAAMVVQFADDETVVDVAASDSHALVSGPRQNFLFWKFKDCMIPQPVLVLTRRANGALRRYDFQIETKPETCQTHAALRGPQDSAPSPNVVNISTGNAKADPPGDLRYIAHDALAEGADVVYTVVFTYPHDEALRRKAAREAAQALADKRETALLLDQQSTYLTANPYTGTRNYRYVARGDHSLVPQYVFDNGYSTAFVFPNQQRMPSIYQINPDGKEAVATYSVHGDTMIATGTAYMWRLRAGGTVLDIYNWGYTSTGATPGTGTVSPLVERKVKGGSEP